MAIDDKTISVNGNSPSWGYLELKIGSERFYGWTGITFGHKLTEVLGYSSGRHHAPTHRSAGKYEVEVLKITNYVKSTRALRAYLASLSESGTSYGSVEWEATLTTVLPGEDDPSEVGFHRVRYLTEASNFEEGPELLKEDIECQPMWIDKDGLVLFDDSQGRPI